MTKEHVYSIVKLFVVAHRVTLVVAFAFLPHNFGKVVGAYDWYFVIL